MAATAGGGMVFSDFVISLLRRTSRKLNFGFVRSSCPVTSLRLADFPVDNIVTAGAGERVVGGSAVHFRFLGGYDAERRRDESGAGVEHLDHLLHLAGCERRDIMP